MSKYGIGYKGSKNKLAEDILALFPRRENFYDLFCGGGAITHCALLQDNFKHYYMNDINPQCIELFLDAATGKFKNEDRWISRNIFFERKAIEPYISFCWSFGNNTRDYLYAKDLEEFKHAWHNAIFYNDFKMGKELLNTDFSPIANIENRHKKYLASKECLRITRSLITAGIQLQFLGRLQSLESLERLERLERLESLESLETSVTSYSNIKIKDNSIIYCDIPYEATDGYTTEFNFEEFYSWCKSQKELVFISSYNISDPDFVCIKEFKHRCTLCANSNIEVTERVFIPKHQLKEYLQVQVQPTLFEEFIY